MWKLARPDAVKVWEDPAVVERFRRYQGILDGNRRARYLIAKKLPAPAPGQTVQELLTQHEILEPEFADLVEDIDAGEIVEEDLATPAFSYLDLKARTAREMLRACQFCERQCGVDRAAGERGACGVPAEATVASCFLHTGEESPLVPSGTIFFVGCTFQCVFCQNFDLSQEWRHARGKRRGVAVNGPKLAQMAESLTEDGARNINYVGGDPTSNLHVILESLKFQDANITQLWNSNLYLTRAALRLLVDVMDFWLPDFKFGNDACGKKYSKVDRYWEVLTRNHQIIHDQGSGEIIIRHLVMPDHVECCSKPILDWVAEHTPRAVINIMGQYRPEYLARKYPEIDRRPTVREMRAVRDHADALGLLWRPVS